MSCRFLITALTACAFSCVAAKDQKFSAGGMEVQIKGKSGKFQVYRKNAGENETNKVEVEMLVLMEVDANGKILAKEARSTSAQHSIRSFASQEFEFLPLELPGHPGDPRGVVYLGYANASAGLHPVKASKTSFTSTVGKASVKIGNQGQQSTSSIYAGKIQVDTYVVTQKGFVGPDDDTLWEVVPGDMKFNIVLSDWTWCGDRRGRGKVECGTDVGKFIDVVVKIKGKNYMPVRKPEPSKGKDKGRAGKGKKSDFAMGGGINLRLTNLVRIIDPFRPGDSQETSTLFEMPEGYPQVHFPIPGKEGHGKDPIFTFRFPRFAKGAVALYDPLLTSGAASAEALASQAAGLSVLPIVSVIFAALASKLLF